MMDKLNTQIRLLNNTSIYIVTTSKTTGLNSYLVQSLPTIMLWVLLFFHVFMLKPATSNTFSKRLQLVPTLIIIDGKPKYEISQIVDSKIDCWRACKLLYKVIWLEYEDTGDESEWIPTMELTHAADLVSDFHITYSTKPSPLPLFWLCCCTCFLPPCIFQQGFPLLIP